MPAPSTAPVVAQHRYESPPERVFDAWLDPAIARRFLFATDDGRMIRAEIDARPGGRFRFTEERTSGVADHRGEYVEVTRPWRLVFTFSAGDPVADRVTVELVPAGEGTDLTLTHEIRPEWADYVDRTRDGWLTVLQGLADVLGELPARPW